MKTLICLFLLFVNTTVLGQDYYSIVKKNDEVTYYYPEYAQITLIDSKGVENVITNEEAIDVTGDYTLSIVVPWSDQPEMIKSDGGRLEVFVLSNIYKNKPRNHKEPLKTRQQNIENYSDSNTSKPYLTKKEITQQSKNGAYELLAVFSNDLVFKFSEGRAWAWINGEKVPVTNHYLVNSSEGLLKLSFDPSNGEFWYVFDTNNKK